MKQRPAKYRYFGVLSLHLILACTLVLSCLNTSLAGNKATQKEAAKLRIKGQNQFKNKQYADAYKTFAQEMNIRKKLKDTEGEALATIYAASALQKQKKYTKSIRYLKNALNMGLEVENNNIVGTCYGMLATACRETGEDKNAVKYYTNFKNYEDHVENKQLKKELHASEQSMQEIEEALEQTENDLEETEQELEETEVVARNRKMKLELVERQQQLNEAQLANEEIEKKKLAVETQNLKIEAQNRQIIIFSLIGGIVLILGLLFVVIRGLRQKKRDSAIIEEQQEKILSSITYAAKIQQAMLPKKEWVKEHIPDYFVFYKPVNKVSGDFYFFSDEGESGGVYLAAVDCTGHGVPGALMSMIANNSLNEIVRSGVQDVSLILDQLHHRIVRALKQHETHNRDGVDIAMCRIDLEKQEIEFAGARNPLIYIQDGVHQIVPGTKRPIGGVFKKKLKEFNKEVLNVEKPTMFYMFSDGFADQFGGQDGRKYYSRNLFTLFEEIHDQPSETQRDILEERLEEWQGDFESIDDVCIVGFRLPGKESTS